MSGKDSVSAKARKNDGTDKEASTTGTEFAGQIDPSIAASASSGIAGLAAFAPTAADVVEGDESTSVVSDAGDTTLPAKETNQENADAMKPDASEAGTFVSGGDGANALSGGESVLPVGVGAAPMPLTDPPGGGQLNVPLENREQSEQAATPSANSASVSGGAAISQDAASTGEETMDEPTSEPVQEPVDTAPTYETWSPDAQFSSSVVEGTPETSALFVLPETDQYDAAIVYEVTDANGVPLDDAQFIIDGNVVRLAPGKTLDFEADGELSIYVTSTNEGGVSGPWEVNITVADVAEDITLGDGGVSFVDASVTETSVHGGDGADTIMGGDGGTRLSGGGGADSLLGGSRNDTLSGGTGDDVVLAGSGDDVILGASGDDAVVGGSGDDTLTGGEGSDVVKGGAGTDTAVWDGDISDFAISYDAASGTFTITDLSQDGVDEGSDSVSEVEVFEFAGVRYTRDDLVTEADRQANTAPSDIAFATGGSVAENSEAGTVVATLTATDVDGDTLTYTLTDANGNPVEDSNFEIVGNEVRVKDGADLDFESEGAHEIYVAISDDYETSAPESVIVTVTDEAEQIRLGGGDDLFVDTGVTETEVHGDHGDDTIIGSDGDDNFIGFAGSDRLEGGAGDDSLHGGAGQDTILGGADNDTLDGTFGNDVLDGGDGDDTAVYAGAFENFSIVYDAVADVFTISDTDRDDAGNEGTDTVTGVEFFEFAGVRYSRDDLITEADRQANTAPTDVELASGGSVAENSDAGTIVATLTATNVDGNALTYTLTDAEGNPIDDANFVIKGDEVRVKDGADLDFEAREAHEIYVVVSDDYETSALLAIKVTVTDEAETIKLGDDGEVFADASVAETSVTGGEGADTISGTSDNDRLDGWSGDDWVSGGAGNDHVGGGGGDDTVLGGAGNDTLSGWTGDDSIAGGEGTDEVTYDGAMEDFSVVYDASNDSFVITDLNVGDGLAEGQDTVTGVETFVFGSTQISKEDLIIEADRQANTAPTDVVVATGGSVAENSEGGSVVATLTATDVDGDTLTYMLTDADGKPAVDDNFEIVGNEVRVKDGAALDFEGQDTHEIYVVVSDDHETSTPGRISLTVADTAEDIQLGDEGHVFRDIGVAEASVAGGSGDDTITAHESGGSLHGGDGADSLIGGDGDDWIAGGWDTDSIEGGAGNDTIYADDATRAAGWGWDTLDGGDGDDLIVGTNGHQHISGGDGNDTINGGDDWTTADIDTLDGGDGNDLINSGMYRTPQDADNEANGDLMTGGQGDDTIVGGTAQDTLFGGADNDSLDGGSAADTLEGGSGDDFIDGGESEAKSSLVVHLDFEDGAVSTAFDNSGNSHHGEYKGGAVAGASGWNGEGTAVALDGTDDYVEIADHEAFDMPEGTIAIRFNPDEVSGTQALISRDSSHYDGGGHFRLVVTDSGALSLRMQDQSGNHTLATDAGVVTAGNWHHVAVTFGAEGVRLFVDGELLEFNSYTGGIAGNDEPWTLGADQWQSGDAIADNLKHFFDGALDEFAVFDTPLSEADVAKLATGGVSEFVDEDVAVYGSSISDFDISYDADTHTFTIVDQNAANGDEGTDTVTGVEKFVFDGVTYTLADMHQEVERQANVAPSGPSVASGGSVAENSGAGTVAATLSASDANGDSLSFTLTDADGNPVEDDNFEIVGDEVRVKDGADLDFESNETHEIFVVVSDDYETTPPERISITVTDQAENIQLANDGQSFSDVGVAETSITGGTGDDTIVGHIGGSNIEGAAGHDNLSGGSGRDSISGGVGNDSISGGVGNDSISGGSGHDSISGGVGNDSLMGGGGNDTFSFEAGFGTDTLDAGLGWDLLDFSGVKDAVTVEFTADETGTATLGDSSVSFGDIERIATGDGNDTITADVMFDGTYSTGAGRDSVSSGSTGDSIDLGSGDDIVRGNGGADTIDGGEGTDTAAYSGASSDYDISVDETTGILKVIDLRDGSPDGTDELTGIERLEFSDGTVVVATRSADSPNIRASSEREIFVGSEAHDYASFTRSGEGIEIDLSDDQSERGGLAEGDVFQGGIEQIDASYHDDTLIGGMDVRLMKGWGGNDSIVGSANDEVIYGNQDDDTIDGGAGNDTAAYAGALDDFDIRYDAATKTFTVTDLNVADGVDEGTDLVTGVEGFAFDGVRYSSDEIAALGSDQEDAEDNPDTTTSQSDATFAGSDNADTHWAGSNDDVIYGLGGNDTLGGSDGNDRIDGGAGSDQLFGGAGNDTFYGGSGNDVVYAHGDADEVFGDAGADSLYGDGGDDTIRGGSDNDMIFAGADNDLLYGDSGDDQIRGENGADTLYGGSGNDTLGGGGGDDILYGGTGDDDLVGDDGNDRFYFNALEGNDTVNGGGNGWTDVIVLEGMGDRVKIDGETVYGEGWTMVLEGGASVKGQSLDSLELSPDAVGTITFDDGGVVDFTGIERVEY